MSLTGQQTRSGSGSAPAARGQQANSRPGAPKGTGQMTMPPGRTWLWLLGILFANYLLVRLLIPSPEAPVTVPYTLFKDEVGKGNVEAIYSQGESITGRFSAPVTYPPANEKSAAPKGEPQTTSERGAAPREVPKAVSNFTTTLPSFVDPGLEDF
jgi:cell division protease FtsH